jgi:hypothetical protein
MGAGIEGHVIWWEDADWAAQEDATDLLDAEEIGFYAEGLMAEGFGLIWQVLAETEAPEEPAVALLFFWQGQEAPPAPPPQEGWRVIATDSWAAA